MLDAYKVQKSQSIIQLANFPYDFIARLQLAKVSSI